MSPRYFEIIITGRQLAALVVGVLAAIAVGFAAGLGVRALQPRAAPVAVAAVPTAPVVVAAVPTAPVRSAPPAVPSPTAVANAVPIPSPTSTARPTQTPRATPPAVAVAPNAGHRWVQVVALSSRHQAEGARNRVIALGFAPRQVVIEPAGGKFRVRVGPFPDGESAGRVSARLRAEGFRGTYVVREGD